MGDSFERMWGPFLQEQKKGAKGQRLAKLQEDLTGTKMLMKAVVWPVFQTFEDLSLEHEVRTRSGSRIYVDVFHTRLRIAFEEEHYVTHAELVTRDRYNFERFRVRSLANRRIVYYPYSRDELVKKPDLCRQELHELIGSLGNMEGSGLMDLPVYEREVIRCVALASGSFRLADVASWLRVDKRTGKKVIDSMESKQLIKRVGGGALRVHAFALEEKAWMLFQR